MKRIAASCLALTFIAISTGPALAEDKAQSTPPVTPAAVEPAPVAKKPQTICPIMGNPIDKSVYVEKNGLRIYACCKGCNPAIEKDFAKIAAKLEAEGVAVQKVQVLCPVMTDEKINKKLFVDHDGKRIYVCCGSCISKVKKDPAKYIEQLEKQGITLDTVPAPKK
jgi:hypothetical protein